VYATSVHDAIGAFQIILNEWTNNENKGVCSVCILVYVFVCDELILLATIVIVMVVAGVAVLLCCCVAVLWGCCRCCGCWCGGYDTKKKKIKQNWIKRKQRRY